MMIPIASLEALEEFLGEKLAPYDAGPPIAHPGLRLSQVCRQVALEIRNGNASAVRVAVQILTKDPGMPFGKLIKSGFARALKQRADLLSEMQRRGLIAKTVALLELEFCPRETEDYCKLIKKFDPGELLARIEDVRVTDAKSRMLLQSLIADGARRTAASQQHYSQMISKGTPGSSSASLPESGYFRCPSEYLVTKTL
ncbi:hypothetical protein [Janthinobacterium sp. SUN206]|uniref:hypothetical protein n=1 Tax=Janthinobacterium sp. SUN206 TaxID=3014787 RepID=UPI002712C9EB|nr:hypothetical protein [Janthinobacterium sp. SUN206]MDO8064751.1 hypothetical protein [Janthinobacterium sp. SUN206]